MLPIIPLHRSYERKCRDCGHTWTVPRVAASQGAFTGSAVRTVRSSQKWGGANFGQFAGSSVGATRANLDALGSVSSSLNQCNACGSDQFDQRPVKRSH